MCVLEMELLERLLSSLEKLPFFTVMYAGEQSHSHLNERSGFLEDPNGKFAV